MNIYFFLENTEKRIIFLYVGVLLFLIFIFRNRDIKLNILLALFIGAITILYIHQKNEASNIREQKQQELKLETIKPPTTKFKDRDDIIDFFFSVQDFYHYNPQTYEDAVLNVEELLVVHKVISIGTKYCDYYYNLAEERKGEALNAFHALIYSLPDNLIILEKFNRAHKRLETILNKYINEIYDMCKNDLIRNGYNIHRRVINTGPSEYNKYDNENFTFQFY